MAVAASPSRARTDGPEDSPFSLVGGGLLFQILSRLRLIDADLRFLPRRILVAVLLCWAPVIAFSGVEGSLIGGDRTLPLLQNFGFHLRFLVVLPLLIGAEVVVHRRMGPIIEQFRVRGLIPPEQGARFADALRQVDRLRNSPGVELVLLALVYVIGIALSLQRLAQFGEDGWYGAPSGNGRLSLAGLWLLFVSGPLFQFVLLRWYFRMCVWTLFLWRVSRLDLDLHATHPDRSGGLGFLSDSLIAFAPLAIAHGTLFAGMIADRILYSGAQLGDFQLEVFAGALLVAVVFAGPLTVFGPLLARVKYAGVRRYGALGQEYARKFERKWLAGPAPVDELLIGSGDIQTLADLGNSFAAAEQMRFTPIRPVRLVLFVGVFAAPMLPLLFSAMSPQTIIARLVEVIF